MVEFPNYAALFFAGHDAGQKAGKARRVSDAFARYPTDPEGAQTALIQNGAVDEANAVGTLRRQQRSDQAGVQAQEQYASDPLKAQQTAAFGGNAAMAESIAKLDTTQKAALDHKLQIVGGIAHTLQGVKDPNERAALWEQTKPHLVQQGILKPEDVANVDLSDNGLQTYVSQALGIKGLLEQENKVRDDNKPVSVADGNRLVNPITGKEVYSAPAKAEKPVYEHSTDANGNDVIVQMNGGGATGAQSGAPGPRIAGAVGQQIDAAAQTAGATPQELDYLHRTAQVESSGRPKAQNGSSTGVFQFHPATFASVGGKDITSVQDQTVAALNLARKDKAELQSVLGREPTPAELYIAHQQGGAGGRALMTAPPETNAVAALTPAYNGDARMARLAIVGNGGTPDMTAGEFVDHWREKFGGGQAAPAADSPGGPRVVYQGGAKKAATKWQVLIDPKDQTPYRYDADTGRSTTLTGEPYKPTGASKMGGGTPRSATAMALQRYLQENPEATAEDISKFNAVISRERKASSDFATGKQGQTVNSLNVSIDHLSTLGNLADALKNGNVPIFNKWAQAYKTQTGNPAPTNFNTAKQIVADEIIKGIVGSGGGVADRQHAQDLIHAASSPAQLAGVIGTYQQLLAGQLNGLRLQYKNSTGLDDFETKLLPETRAHLEKLGVGAPATAPAAPVTQGQGWKVLKVH